MEWDQNGLQEAWNQSFRKNSIPQIDSSDKIAREILDRNPRIRNPKPDIVWALNPEVFDEERMKINKMYYAQTGICPADIWHPFSILEARIEAHTRGCHMPIRSRGRGSCLRHPLTQSRRRPP